MIEKLQIQNFRGFSQLTLEGLKRVNLVVGRKERGGEETSERVLSKIDSRIKKVKLMREENTNKIVLDTGLAELIPLTFGVSRACYPPKAFHDE